ncbi:MULTISPECIES: LysR family transcriptional regulator [unclassified Methylibium]|uniref:LysR family transcriptional regulator n=1 Tax=unclassified Methylibium TaxID=2633235 RepID=UPI0003F4515A|nr:MULTISPECIES: LysR family transcriptional regulator [unclassified Methylibium]EWS55805.1 D-malate degradation protein R [Methylibium sp. T29]EWS62098.1 D-malate degradation protein R [Methylibium sp. T29-B]
MSALETEERLKGIATFVQAVEAGSFALAAARLRQTRSAVGKSIARLEQRLGTRLFNRTTRRQSLTENGQAFFERCKRALAEIEAAEAALDASGRDLIGRLRVSAPLLLGREMVAPLLSRLVALHPRLELEVALSDRVVDLLEEGFDLGVRLGTLRDSATLAARRLGSFDFVICAAPAYLGRRGVPVSADDFRHHTAIVYASSGPEAPWLAADADGREQELLVQRRLRFDDVQAIADAALAGAGLARLPRWLAAPHVAVGNLKFIGDGRHAHAVAVHAVWPQTRHLPMKTRAAIDLLASEIPGMLSDGPRFKAIGEIA